MLVALDDAGSPVVRHWGTDLGPLEDEGVTATGAVLTAPVAHSSYDEPRVAGVLAQPAAGWAGRPSVLGHRLGTAAAATPYFRDWQLTSGDHEVTLSSSDEEAGLAVRCRVGLGPSGVLRVDLALTNTGDAPYAVDRLVASLPVPPRARELLDLTGRWCRERVPQRHGFPQGAWVRESRRGRTGHDATLVLLAGTPGFCFSAGEVWGVHAAWSGSHEHHAEATPEGDRRLGAGELLVPGEVVLAPGETHEAPTLVASWSGEGLDGLSARLHEEVRSQPHLTGLERPVVLNTWEAVYFDHDLATLKRLADVAARVGVERYVLDDGWFQGRTDDTKALGDWTVDRERWPEGLHPLVDHVHGLGLQFGLWVEPEMVNEDSELARSHPDWLLRGRGELPPRWRHQQVLDLQHPDAYAHVRDALLALLDAYDIAFLKWDHNRDLTDATHAGRGAVHGQTRALYRLLDELRERHPALEIETCSSGGARVDLGILARTHRLWASDTNDAVERQHIQRWTTLLVPPELVGSHVGAPTAHTTGRTHRLGFRAATALLFHFGIEWDLLGAAEEDLDRLGAWIALHKQVRPLIRTGRLVHGDHPDPSTLVTGLVSPDGSEAVYVVAQVAASETTRPVPLLLPGLDPARRYRVERADPQEPEPVMEIRRPPWWPGPLEVPASVLTEVGLQLPVLAPETARVLRVVAC